LTSSHCVIAEMMPAASLQRPCRKESRSADSINYTGLSVWKPVIQHTHYNISEVQRQTDNSPGKPG